MCCRKSKNGWLLASLFWLLLVPWPLFSQSLASTSGLNEPSGDILVKEFLEAAKEIATKYPETKPLLLKMANSLTILSERSGNQSKKLSEQVTSLQAEIKTLKNSRMDYEKSQANLTNDLKSEIQKWQALFTVSAIGNGIQLVFNIGQALRN